MKAEWMVPLAVIVILAAWWAVRAYPRGGTGEGPIVPGFNGSPDRTVQNPKVVPWVG